jgi:hypothetical protein
MNLYELTVAAEAEFSTYRHADIDDWIEAIDPVLEAYGESMMGSDKVEDITLTDDSLNIRTSYSVRCCSQSNEISIPVSILKADDPVRAAIASRAKTPVSDTIQIPLAEYEKLKADAGRLDWLIKNKHLDAWWSVGGVADREQNIRDDIDDAMKQEGGA